jgi:DNA-binding NtrC family response regulator
MVIAFALLVSADPVTIGEFSLALRERSISTHICQEAAGAIRLLNRRKFDAVVVDLQLGQQCGLILDALNLSSSNRTAVTFAISSSDVDATAAFRKEGRFSLWAASLSAVNPQHTQACLRTDLEGTAALFSVPHL